MQCALQKLFSVQREEFIIIYICGKKPLWTVSQYYPVIFFEGLKNNKKWNEINSATVPISITAKLNMLNKWLYYFSNSCTYYCQAEHA